MKPDTSTRDAVISYRHYLKEPLIGLVIGAWFGAKVTEDGDPHPTRAVFILSCALAWGVAGIGVSIDELLKEHDVAFSQRLFFRCSYDALIAGLGASAVIVFMVPNVSYIFFAALVASLTGLGLVVGAVAKVGYDLFAGSSTLEASPSREAGQDSKGEPPAAA